MQRVISRISMVFALALASGSVWSFNPLQSFGKAMEEALQSNQVAPARPATTPRAASAEQDLGIAMASDREIVYAGYAKEMLPIKGLIADGKAGEALKSRTTTDGKAGKLDMLGNLELATIALDAGALDQAKQGFEAAERQLMQKDQRSTVGGVLTGGRDTLLSTLTGNAELAEYPGAGFERVLMLNYKSLVHLLDGERAAYNVTRRAIDLQNIEKQRFDALVREAQEKIKEEEAKQKSKGADMASYGLDAVVEEQYQTMEKQALMVPHAFVNPFGFYFAGLVQELDSYEDSSLRDNARIAYEKALELNPKSAVIKQAVADMRKPADRSRRLVHVIIGEGFAPEKKLLKMSLRLGASLPTVIDLPMYEPVSSRVHRVELQTTAGKRWALASEVADITALALRFQKDSGPLQQLRMMTLVIRNIVEGQAWNQAQEKGGIFGSMIGVVREAREELAHPDMRSWSTLPSRMMAARFFVPSSVSRLKVVAYDARGKELSSQVISIDQENHNVVFVRVIDATMYTASSKTMWVGL